MDARRIVIPAKLGLALLAAWPALTIGLSAVGERVALVQAVAVLGLLPALLGAVTWLRAGQRSRKVFLRKRLFTLVSLALALSVPLTHWPLLLMVKASEKDLNVYTCDYREEYADILSFLGGHCGNPAMHMEEMFRKTLPLPRNMGGLHPAYAHFYTDDKDNDYLKVILRSGAPELRYDLKHHRWEIWP